MAKAMHPQIGGLFEDWLKDEELHADVTTASVKRVLGLAAQAGDGGRKDLQVGDGQTMETSRPQLDRLLDPENGNVTLDTLTKAAAASGRKARLELI